MDNNKTVNSKNRKINLGILLTSTITHTILAVFLIDKRWNSKHSLQFRIVICLFYIILAVVVTQIIIRHTFLIRMEESRIEKQERRERIEIAKNRNWKNASEKEVEKWEGAYRNYYTFRRSQIRRDIENRRLSSGDLDYQALPLSKNDLEYKDYKSKLCDLSLEIDKQGGIFGFIDLKDIKNSLELEFEKYFQLALADFLAKQLEEDYVRYLNYKSEESHNNFLEHKKKVLKVIEDDAHKIEIADLIDKNLKTIKRNALQENGVQFTQDGVAGTVVTKCQTIKKLGQYSKSDIQQLKRSSKRKSISGESRISFEPNIEVSQRDNHPIKRIDLRTYKYKINNTTNKNKTYRDYDKDFISVGCGVEIENQLPEQVILFLEEILDLRLLRYYNNPNDRDDQYNNRFYIDYNKFTDISSLQTKYQLITDNRRINIEYEQYIEIQYIEIENIFVLFCKIIAYGSNQANMMECDIQDFFILPTSNKKKDDNRKRTALEKFDDDIIQEAVKMTLLIEEMLQPQIYNPYKTISTGNSQEFDIEGENKDYTEMDKKVEKGLEDAKRVAWKAAVQMQNKTTINQQYEEEYNEFLKEHPDKKLSLRDRLEGLGKIQTIDQKLQ